MKVWKAIMSVSWEVKRMRKLLSANFMRLRKEKIFWILFCFMCVLGIAFPVFTKIDEIRTGTINSIDNVFGQYAIFIGIVMAIFCSFFIGQEYSDGTIRNKIISGGKRTDIYLASFVTCTTVSGIMCCGFFLVYLYVGIPLLGFFSIDIKTALLLFLTVIFLSAAFSAVYTLIAASCTNKAAAAVICVLLAFLFLFIGMRLNNMLSQPETVLGMVMEGGTQAYKEFPNPDYLNAEMRRIVQFAYDFIPGGQAAQCAAMEAANLPLLPVYSFIIALSATGMGLFVFKQKDLK